MARSPLSTKAGATEARAPKPTEARERLAVPLDVADLAAARSLVQRLGLGVPDGQDPDASAARAGALDGAPGWLKVGYELFTAAGPEAVRLAGRTARVFLDLKFHDIPNTVAGGVRSAAASGADLLTIHAAGGAAMLRAARAAADAVASDHGGPPLILVGITVLTSLDDDDLGRLGVDRPVSDQVLHLTELALECGLDGVVASPREAAAIRARFGSAPWLVTPGVRPRGSAGSDDQSRVATPEDAIRAGADLLVVGRPILQTPDPGRAASAVIAEIDKALATPSA